VKLSLLLLLLGLAVATVSDVRHFLDTS